MIDQKDNQIKSATQGEDSLVDVLNFVLNKTERLTSALYMVTNILPEAEPLKWRLREKGLLLMSDTNKTLKTILYTHLADKTSHQCPSAEKVIGGLEDVLSLIEIALGGGSVSLMNFTILKKEYLALKEMLVKNFSAENFSQYLLAGEEGKYPSLPVASDLYSQTRQVFSEADNFAQTPKVSNTVTRENKLTTDAQNLPNRLSYKPAVKDEPKQSAKKSESQVKTKGQNYLLDIEESVSNRNFSQPKQVTSPVGKSDRRSVIMSFLAGRDWTSIKDISDQMSGYSTKTVQRELVAMVEEGVLKKTGDRRWSRYMVA